MHSYKRKIRLQETDAAGVLFFSNYFVLSHEAFESFLDRAGIDLAAIIKNNDYFLPIVRAEANYTAPLFIGDIVDIKLDIERVKESSFAVTAHFIKDGMPPAATVKTVHVSIDAKTRQKIPLPKFIGDKLREFSNQI